MTTSKTIEIEKESISILFDVTWYKRKFFLSQVKDYKDSYKLLIMSRVCSDKFFMKCLISKTKKNEKKEEKNLEVHYSHY